MGMDIKEIMSIIPHRQPFLLIDRVEEIVEGEKVIATKNVSYNEPFFAGHFPQEPVMPGVLIVEAMAQAGAVAILSMDEFKGKTAYFGGIKNAKFKKKVVPGDVLRLEVSIEKLKRNAGIGVGKRAAQPEEQRCKGNAHGLPLPEDHHGEGKETKAHNAAFEFPFTDPGDNIGDAAEPAERAGNQNARIAHFMHIDADAVGSLRMFAACHQAQTEAGLIQRDICGD